MAYFRANGSAVAEKNADRQTDTHTNIEKYNIGYLLNFKDTGFKYRLKEYLSK